MTSAASDLVRLAGANRLAGLSVLTMLVAASEGIGFLLLVPLLAQLVPQASTTDSAASPLSAWLAQSDFSPSLAGLLALFVCIIGLRAVADFIRALAAHELNVRIVDGLRAKAMGALVHADWRLLSLMRQSENRALLISTIDLAADAANSFFALLRTGLGLGATLLAALLISPMAALVGVVGGLLVLAAYAGLRRRARMLGEQVTKSHQAIYLTLEENLDALRLVKSFGREEQAERKVAQGFARLRAIQRRFVADTGRAQVLLQLGGAALLAVMAWLAISHWHYNVAVLLPLVAIFARAVPQLGALQSGWQQWAHAAPAFLAARALTERASAGAEPPFDPSVTPPALTRELRLSNVTLRHREGIAALDRINLALQAGEALALVGPSGAGKSTLADLASGLIAPDEGTVEIDGSPLTPELRRAWRNRVAYVQQEPVLFSGSLRDNLRWAAPDASEAELREALEAAQAQFALDLPGGLDCDLGEGGRHLSGGERQRITLARALLRKPALLVLDEATSALDPVSDAAVAEAVSLQKGRCTMLLIGHRGSLTRIADRVVKLESGRLEKD
ncbi:MAG: ABC transporter ATP-binding protein [Sphingomonadaceae bacterium]|nr:ABC transporter ATP-binding protein [Sphingomonadaceae bacterium]